MDLPYPYEIKNIPFKDFSVRLAVLADPEKLFEELISKGKDHPEVKDEQIPYWGELWPSAIGLSDFLSENKNLIEGKNVLEIGCGLGLPGIVAAKLGAKVKLTDYLTAPIAYAAFNWKLNFTSLPDTSLLDWREPENNLPADVLLASDIAYESKAYEPLKNAFHSLVKMGARIIISEPDRGYAREFFEDLKKEYEVITESRDVRTENSVSKVFIHVLHVIPR